MNDTEVQWTTPSPLWDNVADLNTETRQFFRRPAILRFATDNFMNDFASLLQTNPTQLKDFRVRRETWRGPDTSPPVEVVEHLPRRAQKLRRSRRLVQKAATENSPVVLKMSTPTEPLKLYQPAHQRYYLISAGLVCHISGQPDRHIENGNQERVTFVIRKVIPPSGGSIFESDEDTWTEYAFVGNGWMQVENIYSLAPNEEQNPLFAMTYLHDDDRRRRVLAGLIPVGKREVYIGAPERSSTNQIVHDPDLPLPPDPRTLLFMTQVTEPWKRLIEQSFAVNKVQHATPQTQSRDEPMPDAALAASIESNREQFQATSWYLLLDFVKLLKQYIPDVWAAIMDPSKAGSLSADELALLNALINTTISSEYADDLVASNSYVSSDVISNLRDTLKKFQTVLPFQQSGPAPANTIEHDLETVIDPYHRAQGMANGRWPDFLFPLADPVQAGPLPPAKEGVSEQSEALKAALDRIDNFADLIEAALPAQPPEKTPPPLIAAQSVLGIDSPAYFVIRCVFERPNCGPLQPTVISDPTEPFVMAGFFDPDAPARPIRIGLPIDTTLAGLRKFDKNTAFMISDVLCGQIDRAKQLGLGDLVRSVLPFPFHKDLDIPDTGPCPDKVGMICSLSIPIITICALILLMIIVSLLDIIFHWVPFFIMCLPFPKFDGKQPAG
jgi:hypothetical protein